MQASIPSGGLAVTLVSVFSVAGSVEEKASLKPNMSKYYSALCHTAQLHKSLRLYISRTTICFTFTNNSDQVLLKLCPSHVCVLHLKPAERQRRQATTPVGPELTIWQGVYRLV